MRESECASERVSARVRACVRVCVCVRVLNMSCLSLESESIHSWKPPCFCLTVGFVVLLADISHDGFALGLFSASERSAERRLQMPFIFVHVGKAAGGTDRGRMAQSSHDFNTFDMRRCEFPSA